jgi:hypothetical protein
MGSVTVLPQITVEIVDHERASSFVLDYEEKWGLPFDHVRFAAATWFGAWDGPVLCAVMGLEEMPNKSVFVTGLYSDATRRGKRGLAKLLDFLDTVPRPLLATVLSANTEMIDFTLKRLNKRHRRWSTHALVIHSPFDSTGTTPISAPTSDII